MSESTGEQDCRMFSRDTGTHTDEMSTSVVVWKPIPMLDPW